MKKTVLLFTFSFISLGLFAQKDTIGLNLPVKDNAIVYEQVVSAEGKSKADLYKNAKQWFVDYFKSSKEVIQSEDKEDGKIIGKGIIAVPFKGMMGMSVIYNDKLTIQIDCRDGKYRCKIYDMLLATQDDVTLKTTPETIMNKLLGKEKSPFNDAQSRRMLLSVDTETKKTLSSLKAAMIKSTDSF